MSRASACMPSQSRRAGSGSFSRALRLWWYRWLRRERLGREARRPFIARFADPRDDMLQALLQEAGSAVAVLDLRGRVMRSCKLASLLGAAASEGSDFVKLLPLADRKPVRDQLHDAVHAPEPVRLVLELKTAVAGEIRFVEIGIAPIRELDGRASGLIVRLRNVTELRRLQTQLAHSQRLQALGQLAGGIAHDFNNLLTTVIGAADEVMRAPDLAATILADVEQMRESAFSGARLVRQLLAFGRQQALQPVRLLVNAEIERLAGVLRRTLGTDIRLELDLQQPTRAIDMDLSQFEQVLINLAVNARDAMPEGGRMVLRAYASVIESTPSGSTLESGTPAAGRHASWFTAPAGETMSSGRQVVIEVEDDGVGMTPATLERIFDPFFTTRREQGGNGLGLSTVLGIIRQSGGFIDVRSEAGRGTCFRIQMPEAPLKAPQSAAAPIAPSALPVRSSADGAAPTVLLVEDEAPVRLLAERAMRRRGWTVIAAASGDAALLDLAPGQTLDLVVTDVVMPGMNGPELVRRLRGERAALPAILVSGYAEDAVRGDLRAESMTFLPKPYRLAELLQVMEGTLASGDECIQL